MRQKSKKGYQERCYTKSMRRLILLFFLIAFLFLTTSVSATGERYATCDLCGFCVPAGSVPSEWTPITPPPQWDRCSVCLYPGAGNAHSGNTLLVDPLTNKPPEPQPGHHFTMLGCLSTELNDFTAGGAAGNVVQSLLNVITSAAGGVAFLYLLYGAFIVATSQSDSEKLNHGKRIIVGAIIGLLFVLFSVFIINLIASGILKIPGFSTI